ncbi:MAG: TRAP transporter small permease subunit [Desulfomonilaceae bacterium]
MFPLIKSCVQKGTRILGYVAMVLIFPMMFLTSADAIRRDIWSKPIPGSFEMSSYILAIFILLGIAYAHQMKDHVRVTIFIDRLPVKLNIAISIFTTSLSLFIIGVMAYQGWVLTEETVAVSDMLRIPQWPFRLLVFVGGAFLFLELLIDLADYMARLFK